MNFSSKLEEIPVTIALKKNVKYLGISQKVYKTYTLKATKHL